MVHLPQGPQGFSGSRSDVDYDFGLLDEVARITEDQRTRFLRKIRQALWTLKGKRLAVLGLAFKGGTGDIRESPAIALVHRLLKEGCEVRAYDPAAMERARKVLQSPRLILVQSAYDAAKDADVLVIMTEWDEFAHLDVERLRRLLTYPIVIDGRNLYDPEVMARAGFIYSSIGRPDVQPSHSGMKRAAAAMAEAI